MTHSGTVRVVNVKPAGRLEDPKVAEALAWPGQLIGRHGWEYEVWSGADRVLLEKVRFLAGYRHPGVVPEDEVERARQEVTDGEEMALAERRLAGDRPTEETGLSISFDGEQFTVAEIEGRRILLRQVAVAGAPKWQVDISVLLAHPTTEVLVPVPEEETATAAVLSGLADEDDDELTAKVQHVQEVLTGYRLGDAVLALEGEPRADYAPGTPMLHRYAAKAGELGVGVSTVRRWTAAVKDLYELLRQLSKGTNAFEGSTKGKRSIADAPQDTCGRLRATRPGEYVVLTPTAWMSSRWTFTAGASRGCG